MSSAKKKPAGLRADDLADHIGTLIQVGELNGAYLVAQEEALRCLRPLALAHCNELRLPNGQRGYVPAPLSDDDLKNGDIGVPFALMVASNSKHRREIVAAELLRMCINALEQPGLQALLSPRLPKLVASLVVFETDAQRARAQKARQHRRGFHSEVAEDVENYPEENWKSRANRLEGDGVIVRWDEKEIVYLDDDENEKQMKVGSFKNLISSKLTKNHN